MSKIKLSKEDKIKFQNEVKKLNVQEFLQAIAELETVKDRFTSTDWKFITSNMGKRAYCFLKNVAYNNSFDNNNNEQDIWSKS